MKSIAFFQSARSAGVDNTLKQPFQKLNGYDKIAVATELFEIYSRGLISSSSAISDPAGICPSNLLVTGVGAQIYNLMGLNEFIDPRDLELPFKLLTNGNGENTESTNESISAGTTTATYA